ncbi:MAG: 50S ribosomal protein L4 [Candidatus Omnitrophota bacterium]
MSMQLPVYNQQGKETQKIKLDPAIFDGKVNEDVLYQAVLMYRANRRKGLADTLTRGEVSGSGKKPWRQKGTGRARVGSIRSPLWRKGGVIFGPHPRDFGFELPQKIRIAALKSSLNAKLNENNLLILDEVNIGSSKTKEAVKILSNLKLEKKSTLLMLEKIDINAKLSFRNIGFFGIIRASDANAYRILSANKLILTLNALKILAGRIKDAYTK